ncbi:MAG: hypothetical protein AVDCRST_MAG30-822, partial [uncultured Solirubrobacteraceae bacterium]
ETESSPPRDRCRVVPARGRLSHADRPGPARDGPRRADAELRLAGGGRRGLRLRRDRRGLTVHRAHHRAPPARDRDPLHDLDELPRGHRPPGCQAHARRVRRQHRPVGDARDHRVARRAGRPRPAARRLPGPPAHGGRGPQHARLGRGVRARRHLLGQPLGRSPRHPRHRVRQRDRLHLPVRRHAGLGDLQPARPRLRPARDGGHRRPRRHGRRPHGPGGSQRDLERADARRRPGPRPPRLGLDRAPLRQLLEVEPREARREPRRLGLARRHPDRHHGVGPRHRQRPVPGRQLQVEPLHDLRRGRPGHPRDAHRDARAARLAAADLHRLLLAGPQLELERRDDRPREVLRRHERRPAGQGRVHRRDPRPAGRPPDRL